MNPGAFMGKDEVMNRLALFGQSLSILWRRKGLWVFGLLAALGGGGLNSLASLANFNSLRPFAEMPLGLSPASFRAWLGLTVAQMLTAGLVLGLMSFLIHTYAESALISMIGAIGAGETPTVGDGVRGGLHKFVPLLATKALLAVPIVILYALATGSFLSVFLGTFADRNQTLPIFFNAGAMLGLVLLTNLVYLLSMAVSISAKRAIVLEDISVTAAIVRGWRLIWAKFSDYFVIALLLILLGFLLNALILAATLSNLFSSSDIFGAVTTVSVIINLVVGGFTSIFISSVWTLAFRKWQAGDTTAVNHSVII